MTTNPDPMPTEPASPALSTEAIDWLLEAQIIVAWAGEGGEEPRLGWWKTDLWSEYGGQDLFKRLLPNTFDWALVQALREAARRHDAALRGEVQEPDSIVSLYRLGFAIDERADERLLQLKRTEQAPSLAFPRFGELESEGWQRDAFEAWLTTHGKTKHSAAPAGRHIAGPPPGDLIQIVSQLVGALSPLGERYPLPHFRQAAHRRASAQASSAQGEA